MITISAESNFANARQFDSIEDVLDEVARYAPARDCGRYGDSDALYVARLLDIPESAVTIS